MKKITATLAAALMVLGAVTAQAQWTYFDVADAVNPAPNNPSAQNTFDNGVFTDDPGIWAQGLDNNSVYGWRYRATTGPGAPAFNNTAYSGFGTSNQFNNLPDPPLYTLVSGLVPDTEYRVRLYGVFAASVTNANIAVRTRGAIQVSFDLGSTWEQEDTHSSIIQVVNNATGVGTDLSAPAAAGDWRGYILLTSTLTTDGAGNGRIDVRLPARLLDNTANDRFHLDGYALGIPEPSTFALAGLGAAALLIFRRRS